MRVAPNLLETIRARLGLGFGQSPHTITIGNRSELNQFVAAAAYWSQPVSRGDQRWSEENQRQLHAVLMQVLKKAQRTQNESNNN